LELGVVIAGTGNAGVSFDSPQFAALESRALRGMGSATESAACISAFSRAAARLGLRHALVTPACAAALFTTLQSECTRAYTRPCKAEAKLRALLRGGGGGNGNGGDGSSSDDEDGVGADLFAALWNGTVTDAAAVEALNARFAARRFCNAPVVPFETCYGPRVRGSADGAVTFLDMEAILARDGLRRLTGAELNTLRRGKAAYLQRKYGASEQGQPSTTSSHYTLHHATRCVLASSAFSSMMNLADDADAAAEAAQRIAARLQGDGRGAFMEAGLTAAITFAMESYLALRRRGGMAESNNERLPLVEVATEEMRQLWRARVSNVKS
jgi:hypothetical protein